MISQGLRPRALLALIPVIAASLSACSGGGSTNANLSKTDPLSTVAKAMRQAGSGHIAGTVDAPKRKPKELSGVWKGGIQGESQSNATFTTRKGVLLPAELRVVDHVMYYRRTVAAVTGEPALGIFARASDFKPWKAARVAGIVTVIPAAFSPAALVEWLQQLKIPVRVNIGKTTHITTTRPLAIGVWLGATVDLTIDKRARVVAVQITAPTGGARYTVSDFGARVAVQAPPAALISRGSELPVKKPAGAFTTVRSGTTNGVTWSLQRAPGTAGTVCWRWKASPPLPEAGLKRPGDPRCVTRAGAHPDPEDTVTFVVDGNGTGSYDALAIELPAGAKDVKLGLVGGKIMPLAAGPVVVWVGPTEPAKGYLGVTLADGTKLDCGAGAIATPDDLTDPTVTRDAAAAAWGCLQHAA